MSETLQVVAGIAVVAFVIGRQLLGEPLRGKRVVLLPVILTVVGITQLGHLGGTDVALLVLGGVVVAGIGAAQGRMLRLAERDGALWGQLPPRGLWLWVLLVGSRVLLTVLAVGLHAHAAAGTSTILLMLGINRLGQAAVIVARAASSGIQFAPEKDGRSLLAGLMGGPATAPATAPAAGPQALDATLTRTPERIDWSGLARRVGDYLDERSRAS